MEEKEDWREGEKGRKRKRGVPDNTSGEMNNPKIG
jgi:hypothetical protein